jgi:hypothetical protein
MAPRERISDKPQRRRGSDDQDGFDSREYAAALRIDKNALDEALIEQPDLFYRIAEALAMAISRRDAAKQELEIVEAETDRAVRVSMARGGEKTTEPGIKNAVRLHKDVIAATNELGDLQTEVGKISAMKEAYQQRSYVLKDLVALHIRSYYGDTTPGAPGTDARAAKYSHDRADMASERRRRGG